MSEAQAVADKDSAPKKAASSRDRTVLIGGHFPPEVHKQLRIIAAEEETTHQALLAEALNLLFKKKGKPALAH